MKSKLYLRKEGLDKILLIKSIMNFNRGWPRPSIYLLCQKIIFEFSTPDPEKQELKP